jgi:hypothetical protein
MTQEQYTIYNSRLEEARNTSDIQWLNAAFTRAREVIDGGGRVHIMQRFSDASEELVEIIDNMETLEFYRQKYTP